METTLYDGHGHPIAYIADDDEHSIYLWSGPAVAYIVDENLFGWNGRHLGWFVDGVLYNLKGYRVGSVRNKCSHAVYEGHAKYAKYIKHAKHARYAASARPTLKLSYSNEDLSGLLKQGMV